MLRRRFLVPLIFLCGLGAMAGLAGCTPHIGDRCNLNTDCSISNTRQCDNSQPNGYCTVFNCAPNSCPDNAACVVFQASVPGCPYDDYSSPARTDRSFCMATCQRDSDCRTGDGYVCRSPGDLAGSAGTSVVIIDVDPAQRICVLSPTRTAAGAPDDALPVCPGAQTDASAEAIDAGAAPGADAAADSGAVAIDGGRDAGRDAATDAAGPPVDASADAGGDAPADAPADAETDAALDGTAEGAADAGTADAADTGSD